MAGSDRAIGRLGRERLPDQQRPVGELIAGRDERHLGLTVGQVLDRKQALERRDSATGDHDPLRSCLDHGYDPTDRRGGKASERRPGRCGQLLRRLDL